MERVVWYLGESKTITVSGANNISSADYSVYDLGIEETILTGEATLSGTVAYFVYTPASGGDYVSEIDYTIGSEDLTERRYIEVKETL